jgi:hypothetical protein
MVSAILLLISVQVVAAGGPYVTQARGVACARPGLRGTQARLMAERGAQVVAARNLLAQPFGARQRATPGYRHVTGVVAGHRYSPATYLPDGRAEVVVRRQWGR